MIRRAAVFALLLACAPGPVVDPTERCGDWTHTVRIRSSRDLGLDLALVVSGVGLDDAARAEQAERLARGVRVIVTGDLDEDGLAEWQTYSAVRVAVVSADVGDDGAGIPGCTPIGGDGRFVSCVGAMEHVLDPANVDVALDGVRCALERAMRTTCPRVRPFDAARLALLPASSTVVPGHVPHGDRDHASFVGRTEDDLGVVFLAARDDCSGGASETLVDEASCVRAPGLADPVGVADELVSVRRWMHRVVIAGYAEPLAETSELAAVVPRILADGSIEPACRGAFSASPAPRLARFAGEWGAPASICADGSAWLSTFAGVFPTISRPVGCLPRMLARGEGGLVECRVEVRLPPRERRDRVPSCVALGAASDGSADDVCVLAQVASAASLEASPAVRFAFDDGDAARARCGEPGAELRFASSIDALDPESELTIVCRAGDVADAGVPRCPW